MTKRKRKLDPKYTPQFLEWFRQLQDLINEEVDMANAWELYDERASVQEAAKHIQENW